MSEETKNVSYRTQAAALDAEADLHSLPQASLRRRLRRQAPAPSHPLPRDLWTLTMNLKNLELSQLAAMPLQASRLRRIPPRHPHLPHQSLQGP